MKKKFVLIGIISMICLLVIIGLMASSKYETMKNPHNAFRKDLNKQEESTDDSNKEVSSQKNIINILLLGVDSTEKREAENMGYRSDALMLVSMNLDTKKVKLISVPRDSYTEIPGKKDKDKINHAMAFGGGPKKKGNQYAMEAVETLLDININYYLTMDLDAIQNMVDVIGGVTIDVEKDMYIGENLIIKKGIKKLSGKDALIYLSNRNAPTGDFARIHQQQKFMIALLKEIKNTARFSDIIPLYLSFQNRVFTNLNMDQMGSVILFLKDLDPINHIETFTLKGENMIIDGIYYLKVDRNYIDEILKE